MNSPTISIITPVYQAEADLPACLDSILAQTFTDFELLLIDDESTDRSGEICDEYAARDPRVRVIHQQNGGVSKARNQGLRLARGQWITFIDADDTISPNYLAAIKETDADMIILEAAEAYSDGRIIPLETADLNATGDCIPRKTGQQIHLLLLRLPSAKIIKRACLEGMKFQIGQKLGEDTEFMLRCYKRINSIRTLSGHYYYWRQHDISIKKKYAHSPRHSARSLKNIYKAYKLLGERNTEFELCLLCLFLHVTDRSNMYEVNKDWFKDETIKKIKHNITKSGKKLPWSYKRRQLHAWTIYHTLHPFKYLKRLAMG